MDPQADVRSLVLEVIDPQLLRVALGPDLGPVWVPSLERVYAEIRGRSPAHFHDVDASWRQQRNYWYSLLRSGRRTAAQIDEAEAEDSAAAGSHGVVADVTVGQAGRVRGEAEPAGSNGSAPRTVRTIRAGDAPDPDPDVESVPEALVSDRPAEGLEDGEPEVSVPEDDETPRAGVKLASPSLGCGGTREPAPDVVRGGAKVAGSVGAVRGRAARGFDADPAAGVAALMTAMLHSDHTLKQFRRTWVSSGRGVDSWAWFTLPGDLATVARDRTRT